MTKSLLPIESPVASHRERALRMVPKGIGEYVQEGAVAWGMDVAPLLAGVLHHLCSVQGHRHRLREKHVSHSCPFNLIVCADRPSQDRWFEYIGEPWMGVVRHNMRQHQAKGRAYLAQQNLKLEQSSLLPTGMLGSPVPDQLQRQMFEVANQLRPCLVERRSGAAAAMTALEHSRDRCVLLTNGGVDPVEDLLSSGRKACVDLSSLLSLSWSDLGLPGRSPVPSRGIVHLFWRTHAAALRQLVMANRGPWAVHPPPILLVRQMTCPFLIELAMESHQKAWEQLLQNSLIERLALSDVRSWSLSPAGAQFLVDFRKAARGWQDFAGHRTSPDFFPSLALRMALLLAGMDLNGSCPDESCTIPDSAVERACHLASWMASEHLDCLRWLKVPTAGDVDDILHSVSIDTIDMEALKLAIAEKLQSTGPMSPRDLTRSFHSLRKKVRDMALAGLVKEGKIKELPDGRFAIVPSASKFSSFADNVSVSGG
jgi:hypothetical protein